MSSSGYDSEASIFLTDIGAPQSPDNIKALSVWLASENPFPPYRNNPLNEHADPNTLPGQLPGSAGSVYVNNQDQNVAAFGSLEAGIAANAHLLEQNPRYATALGDLRNQNPTGFLDAIARSGWAASGYGLNMYVNAQGTPIPQNQRGGHWVPNPNGVNRLLTAYHNAGGSDTSGTSGAPNSNPGTGSDSGASSITNLPNNSGTASTSPLDPYNVLNTLGNIIPAFKGLAAIQNAGGIPFADIAVNMIALFLGIFLVIIGLWTLVKGSPPDIGEAIAAGLGAALGPEGAVMSAANAQQSGTSARGALTPQQPTTVLDGQATEFSPETPRRRRSA